ncbi:protein EFR3 homolog B-like isoform X2 [Ptychodera flava]|uniref:protein EFR3 homolog B-like isoform X2 n=1 Tax=Ptychodera flava TaxID=63121 RepID=UPI00396A497B
MPDNRLTSSLTTYVHAGCCSCVSAFKPRWKRLVDNIFPDDPQDGLIKNNMEKLTFYALSSPEKLDRIGVYLAKKLSRDVSRHKHEYVFISMAALDQLLLACHAQSVNLFVESFLKMVQKLLESNEPELQVQGTQSFVKFANIEEDTASYHRRYDFFVSKFSSMCHNNNENDTWRVRLRLSGLRGLQGVVRKTVTDDLQVNIWEQQHMDKIVPSLLFNMHEGPSSSSSSQQDHQNLAKQPEEDGHPSSVAETCLRDLTCRAAFGNIKSVLKPVLSHLDLHDLWVPSTFAVRCFKIIMYSIQAQYSYVAVHMLLNHLDENTKNSPEIKQSIVEVLAECVAIAADGSIGPSVLEVFNTLLRHLRLSVDARLSQRRASKAPMKRASYLDEEQHTRFEDAIINTIGTFATILPDYQKIEIMMFIMGKIPLPTQYEHSDQDSYPIPSVNGEGDLLLQNMLLKSLLEVGTKYTTVSMATTFPISFLEPLLAISVVADAGVRLLVQYILHTLIDRHENVEKLKVITMPKDISQLDLRVEKSSRQDILFMKKNGGQLNWYLYENMRLSDNERDNFEALYCTLALLCIELGGEEVLVELVRLTLALQELARTDAKLSIPHQCAIHAVVATYLNLISQLTAIPSFCQHTQQIIEERRKHAPYLLPDVVFDEKTSTESYPSNLQVEDSLLFQQAVISEVLHSTGHDISRLNTPYVHRPSGIEYRQQTDIDAASANIEIESVSSSPSGTRKHAEEQITFESLKRALQSPTSEQDQQEIEREKRQEILEHFKSSTLDEIAAVSEQRTQKMQSRLNEILDKLSRPGSTTPPRSPPVLTPLSSPSQPVQSVPLYEMTFPELLVY